MRGLAGLAGVSSASGLQTSAGVWPVVEPLAGLLPRGLRRGSTVAVTGSTSVLLGVLAAATAGGAWAAVVGMPDVGVLAAAELGVAVRRLAVVPYPGEQVVGVLTALLDGVELVVVPAECVTGAGAVGGSGADRLARRLSARARHRGAVLLTVGAWPGADVCLDVGTAEWSGVGDGDGYLTARRVVLSCGGRGAAARPRQIRALLPGLGGGVAAAVPVRDEQQSSLSA